MSLFLSRLPSARWAWQYLSQRYLDMAAKVRAVSAGAVSVSERQRGSSASAALDASSTAP